LGSASAPKERGGDNIPTRMTRTIDSAKIEAWRR
jgi:hypothetical protein